MSRSARAPLFRYAVPMLIAGALALPALAASQAPGPMPRGPDPDQIFRTLDLNGDGQIDAAERRQQRLTRFDAMDANKDGRLTKSEIEQAFQKPGRPGDPGDPGGPAGGPPPGARAGGPGPGPKGGPGGGPGPGMNRQQAAERFARQVGADQPGGVSRADFANRENPMLARLDTNGDGKISRSEFDAAAERMKNRPRPPMGLSGPGPTATP